jgi:hypothetical protein
VEGVGRRDCEGAVQGTGIVKPKSDKRRREDEEDSGILDEFARTFPRCWICGEPREIHHIAGRTGRSRHCRANLFAACKEHHALFTDNKWLPTDGTSDRKRFGILVALAYKQLFDRQHYDREAVLKIWGRAPTCITESEVMWEAESIRRERGIGAKP